MHKKINETYHFINKFKESDLANLNSKISLIYRNYKSKTDIVTINKIKKFCKKTKRKLYLANKVKLAYDLGLDGAYIPSFNKDIRHTFFSKRIGFKLIGSAHNFKEIILKERQQVRCIFISPVFKNQKNKSFLGIYRLMLLQKLTHRKIIALGGINNINLKRLKLTNCFGIASISFINKLYNGK
mgnify:CR=1 FL=1|tara:strand:+ start:413 stop:964 length:552 start_codon:yes stop_codon:yes gene_type:complete